MTREGNRREGKASQLHAPCASLSLRICPFTCLFCFSLRTRLFKLPNFECMSVDAMNEVVNPLNWIDAVGDTEVP